jgi:aminopeptidase N
MKWFKSGIFLVIFVSSTFAAPTPFADDGSLRLPKTSVPLNYEITLTTNVHNNGQRSFRGVVKIEIEIKENTNVLTLHNRGLEVQSAKLQTEDGSVVIIQIGEDKAKEFLLITSSREELKAGERYTLEVIYSGFLQTGTSGFYRSSYRVGSVTRYKMLITLSK